MDIINVSYSFRQALEPRKKTNYIIVHHTASFTASVEDIHKWHKIDNGWNGFGYHAYVRKDGNVYAGRPFGTIGAHCMGKNEESIGVCFEGNFEKEQMTEIQIQNGIELLRYLLELYPEAKIVKHSDFFKTSCPGKNFSNDLLIKPYEKENKELKEKKYHLSQLGEDTSHEGLINRLSEIYANILEIDSREESKVVKKIIRRR